MKTKILCFLVLVICLLLPVSVSAKSQQYTFCLVDPESEINATNAYSIIYDDTINTEVSKEKITINVIKDGHIPYPANISENEKIKYQFQASKISNGSCWVETDNEGNETIYSCPKDSTIDYSNILNKYLINVDNQASFNGVDFVFVNGRFNVKIKDFFDNKLYVRYVSAGRSSNENEGYNASYFTGQFLTRNDNGTYNISGVAGDEAIKLEFYQKTSGVCYGEYLGNITIVTPSASDYVVSNPAYSNPNYYGCDLVKDYLPSGMNNNDDISTLNDIKKNYVSECYSSTIKYGEIADLKNTISQKFEKLKDMFTNYTSSAATGSNVCTDVYNGGTKITYNHRGSYWSMICTESYTASGDEPKLVKSGVGFDYQSDFKIVRTCTITQIAKARKRPRCSVSVTPSCSWVRNNGTVGTGMHAGPNDEFDKCIFECDSGEYTQKCINSCYTNVYGNNRDSSIFDSPLSYSNKNNSISFVGSFNSPVFNGPNTDVGCVTESGNTNAREIHFSYNGATYSTCYSAYCGDHSGSCFFTVTVSPDNCSFNPDADYAAAINASQSELNSLLNKQREVISNGKYTYEITDSYLKTDADEPYVFTVKSDVEPMLKVDSSQNNVASNQRTEAYGYDGGGSGTFGTVTSTKNIKVSLPLSYVNKVTSEVVYKSSEQSNKYFTVDYKNNKLVSNQQFDATKYYNQGDRKYYTNILSGNLNIMFDTNNKAQLYRTSDYNILVTSSDVGAGRFNSSIKCYYGVYNAFIDNCGDGPTCPQCDPQTEICDGGIQFIYRPIDLTNIFPGDVNNGIGRNPRWNWTGTLNTVNNISTNASLFASESYLKYDVDPEETIEDIESKGYSIYEVAVDSSEVDYEFVLTKENIRNIRKYNKNVRDYNGDGSTNYLDYNMSCYRNNSGKEICTSRFLDNMDGNSGTETGDNFITYSVSGYGIDSRKSIAGCNNAIGGTECDD